MSQFKFRLQSVQVLRKRTRDQAAESYRQAQLAITMLEDEIQRTLEEHASYTPSPASLTQGAVDPQRLLEAQRYQMHLMQQVAHMRSQITLIEQEAAKRKATLVKCEQAVRSLEKLEDHQREQWQADNQLRAQISLDEWAGFRYWNAEEGS
ncbi:MAG: flagellar export protein FliJ [Pirellulaceae bacterium]